MKSLTAVLISGIFLLAACGNGTVKTISAEKEKTISSPQSTETVKTECKICDLDFKNYKGELSKDEVHGLLLALNDEYMAWAAYDQINKDFDDPRPFINIQKAEARHSDRLKSLFNAYKIPIPDNEWVGKTPKYQSVNEACKAGVEAEIANRDLYTKLFNTTKREDILLVYRNLQRASVENHLPAFRRCGGGRGGRGRG